ncbi:MAG: FtsX-like permease family protein [bacterium]|nr:FtsX-like permease family protein [bacterium]
MNMHNKSKPPRICGKFLKYFSLYNEKHSIVEDLEDTYREILTSAGVFRARMWYYKQVIKSLLEYISLIFSRGIIMFNNYLKIALRNMKRSVGYSFLNIVGLVIGITVSILILLYVQYEFSYDRFHVSSNSIYRILLEWPGYSDKEDWSHSTWSPLAATLKDELPEIEYSTRVRRYEGVVRREINVFNERGIYFADSDFLKMFSFPLVYGNPETALEQPFSILLTEETAQKYFDDENPVEQTIRLMIGSGKFSEYKITGIIKNIPENSHFNFDFLVSFNTWYSLAGGRSRIEHWNGRSPKAYIQLRKDTDPGEVESKFPAFIKKKKDDSLKEMLHLQPLTDIHLQGNWWNELESNSDIRYLYLLISIGFLILLVACYNYMNLSIAHSIRRTKEINIRRVIGANRKQLIWQFLGESFLFTIISLLVSLVLIKLFLPGFSLFMDRNLSINLLYYPATIQYLICLILFIGFISGSYPAFYISSLRLNIIERKSHGFRNILIVKQLAISIVMIICTLAINNQMNYIQNKKLGYDKDTIISLYIRDNQLKRDYESFKEILLTHSNIQDVTLGFNIPPNIKNWDSTKKWEGSNEQKSIVLNYTSFGYDFQNFYNMKISRGRGFSEKYSADHRTSVIINESAANQFGWSDPIGKQFNMLNKNWNIVGVVEDFHFKSLHEKISPLMITLSRSGSTRSIRYISVKINSDDIPETITYLREKWNEYSPDFPFDYSFLDERIDFIYASEQRLGNSFFYISTISICLACLGLFGLTLFSVSQKTKEIGIRKVLGASVPGIFAQIVKEIFRWVGIATIISWPIGYIIMDKWFQNFAYHAGLSLPIFLISAASALIITLLVVSFQAFKAATADPVQSLRYE